MRSDGLPSLLTLAFLDSGRVADEFEPGLRKQFRTDVLLLLAVGIILMAGAVVTAFFLEQGVIAVVLLVVGALFVAGGVALWWSSR